MNIKDKVLEVLAKGHLISLGTSDSAGVWVADLIYIHDDDMNIYWMSDPDARHSRAILTNKKVAGTITTSNKSKEKNLGIQFEGVAEKIDGARFDLAVKHLLKRGHLIPNKDEINHVLQGDSWYVMKLTRIELIDEENFGFNRQTLI